MRFCVVCRSVLPEDRVRCERGHALIERTSTASADPFAPGSRLGDFLVHGGLGQSGLMTGSHSLLRTPVAIRPLDAGLTRDAGAVLRQVEQLHGLNAVGHPAAERVLSIGLLEEERYFRVTELVDGLSLQEIRARAGSLRPGMLVPVFEQLCDLLTRLHAHGLIHGGLTADRVMVLHHPPHPSVRVVGFGQAWLQREPAVAGDIWAAGVMLRELVAGSPDAAAVAPVVQAAVNGIYTSAGELMAALRGAVEPAEWDIDLAPQRASFGGASEVRTVVSGPGGSGPIRAEQTLENAVESLGPWPLAPDISLGEPSVEELDDDSPKLRTDVSGEAPAVEEDTEELFEEEAFTVPGGPPAHVATGGKSGFAGAGPQSIEPRTAVVTQDQVARLLELQRQASAEEAEEDEDDELDGGLQEEPTREARLDVLPPEARPLEPRSTLGRVKLLKRPASDLHKTQPAQIVPGTAAARSDATVKTPALDVPELEEPPDLPPVPLPERPHTDPYLSIEIVGDEDDPEA